VKTKHYHFAHFARILGNPPIHTLTVQVVDAYRTRRLTEGVIGSTVNKETSTLKHALRKAVEWRLLRKSAREALTAIKKFQEPAGRLRYLSGPAEAERLLDACDEWLKPIVTTALHTGMRKGELLGLTWDCVDLTHGFIRLKQTKNGQARGIPFNETLWSLFSGLRTRQDVPWVFHDCDGRRYNDVRHAFDRATAKAGIQDFTFHDLRHTFASWLAMKSIPLGTIGELLGHKNPAQTLRYAHLSPTYLCSAVRVLDGVSDQAPSVKPIGERHELQDEGVGSNSSHMKTSIQNIATMKNPNEQKAR